MINSRPVARRMMRLTLLVLALCASAAIGQLKTDNTDSSPRVVRFPENPIISAGQSELIGDNVNGPSLIRVPSWIKNPLGRYYLYFAHHHGRFIRLAYAESLAGPWKIYEAGTLKLEQTACSGHIASPDVHVDEEKRIIRMYFHGPDARTKKQVTYAAASTDGLTFTASAEVLGDSYFRVFRWGDWYYAMARLGVLYRSRDGMTGFERGGNPLQKDTVESRARHLALKLDGNTLTVYYSKIGDTPEHIVMSTIRLTKDWNTWQATDPVSVLEPQERYEGVDLPLRPSEPGEIIGRARELRDPAIYREKGKTYLLYSVAGESGIGIAEIPAGRDPDKIVVYKKLDAVQLRMHIFNPPDHQSSEKRAAIVFFHGGGWNNGSPTQFYKQCEYLASRGMVAMTAEYRLRDIHHTSPQECVKDGKSAVRWIREHAVELGIDPQRIVAGGGSAGGQVAAAAGTVKGFEEKTENQAVSSKPDALLLFNPVIDNSAEGYGYEKVKEYWREFSPMHNIDDKTPPAVFFLGTNDRLIPVATGERFKELMNIAGVRCDLHLYKDMGHGFFNNKGFFETLLETDRFLVSLGYLAGEPTLENK